MRPSSSLRSLAPRGIGAQEKERNILELFQHKEARQKVNAMPREQALIQRMWSGLHRRRNCKAVNQSEAKMTRQAACYASV